jgi:hypothetical protein
VLPVVFFVGFQMPCKTKPTAASLPII